MAAAKTHANVEVKNVGETRGSTIACPVSPHTRSSTERGMPDASLSLSNSAISKEALMQGSCYSSVSLFAKEQTSFHETRKFTSARYPPIAESSMY
jgi:hypothetical protein